MMEGLMAKIVCVRCGAMPYPPENSGVRQTFDLLKLAQRKDRDAGIFYWTPADEKEGEWFCERHRRAIGGGHYSVSETGAWPR
jgi:hypothetical protein